MVVSRALASGDFWERARLAGLDPSGQLTVTPVLGNPVGELRFRVPPMRLVNASEGGNQLDRTPPWRTASRTPLCLAWGGHHEEWRSQAPWQGSLDQFIRLADAPPEAILRFAQRWGVLGICNHGEPGGQFHTAHGCNGVLFRGISDARVDGHVAWEPLDAWYFYSRRTRELLRAALNILDGRPIDNEMIPLQVHDQDGQPLPLSRVLLHQRFLLNRYLTEWLRNHTHVAMEWFQDAAAPHAELQVDGLYGALGLQVAAAISSPIGLHQCDECKLPYTPAKRRPATGRLHYCSICSEGNRAAKRRSWQKRQERIRRGTRTDGENSSNDAAC